MFPGRRQVCKWHQDMCILGDLGPRNLDTINATNIVTEQQDIKVQGPRRKSLFIPGVIVSHTAGQVLDTVEYLDEIAPPLGVGVGLAMRRVDV